MRYSIDQRPTVVASLLGAALLLLSGASADYSLEDDWYSDVHKFGPPSYDESSLSSDGRDTGYTVKSICIDGSTMAIVDGDRCDYKVATGRYRNSINATGWSYLEIETFNDYVSAGLQAYAAGVLEGDLTRQVLAYHIENTITDYCKGHEAYCDRLNAYLRENLDYVQKQIEAAAPNDTYWQAVNRSYAQLNGVWDGYRNLADFSESADRSIIKIHPILMINTNGDLIDLEKKFNRTKDFSVDAINGKCSGFVKVAPDNSDILVSQVTMSGFQNMLRVLKLYKFRYDDKPWTSTFSSYPGMLYSSDDFALLSTGLAVIETTINVFNATLNNEIQPQGQLHTWVRATVANSLATDGQSWCELVRRYNSGTYNNQWVVLNYNLFKPGQPLPNSGLLYVLEQLPGYTVYRDVTPYLKRNTYYASYNIPFFKSISAKSGFDDQAKKYDWFSWSKCPRSRIFARDHVKVKDLDTLTSLMRYNDYTHEEFSRCDCVPPYTAEASISTRGDLNLANGTYPLKGMGHVNHGALDYKGTNYELFKSLQFRAWSGPTYENVPAFSWSTFDMAPTIKHVGHPDTWKFLPEVYKWTTPVH